MPKKISKEEFLKRLEKENSEIELIGDFVNCSIHTKFRHNCDLCNNYEWDAEPGRLLGKNKTGCPECAIKRRAEKQKLTVDEIKEKIKDKVGNEYTYISHEYKSGGTKNKKELYLKIRHNCDLCNNYEWDVLIQNFMRKTNPVRCPKCGNKICKTLDEWKKDLTMLVNNEYEIISSEQPSSSNKYKVTMKHNCDLCNNYEWDVSLYRFFDGTRCPECYKITNKSKAVRDIENFLNNNNIKYETEIKFEDCKNIFCLPFDFKIFIDKENFFLLEYDGEFHDQAIIDKETLVKQQKRDSIKDEYCKEKNIDLYRIHYTENHILKINELVNFYINRKGE